MKKNKLSFPRGLGRRFGFWRVLWRRRRRGSFALGQLFDKFVKDTEENHRPFCELLDGIIDREEGANYYDKEAVFIEKTNLSKKFIADKKKHGKATRNVVAIIMGHSVDELPNEAARELLNAAGVSLENVNPMNQIYGFLLSLRGEHDFEKCISKLPADDKSRRIRTANQILFDIYVSDLRIQKLFEHRSKRKGRKTQRVFPQEFVLGVYTEPAME